MRVTICAILALFSVAIHAAPPVFVRNAARSTLPNPTPTPVPLPECPTLWSYEAGIGLVCTLRPTPTPPPLPECPIHWSTKAGIGPVCSPRPTPTLPLLPVCPTDWKSIDGIGPVCNPRPNSESTVTSPTSTVTSSTVTVTSSTSLLLSRFPTVCLEIKRNTTEEWLLWSLAQTLNDWCWKV